ncbi:Gfo/Idh/MocA family oxidoreductase, partial [bacterium]|nr:Gfo/Idh/MocA family oxidoreductase [bacterium]
MLKGGIVGCGWISHFSHIPAFRKIKNAEIIAVCDQSEELARKTASRFNIPKAYRDFSLMLKEEQLDFIDICSPPHTHFELCMEAMEAGLHNLTEKPMVLNTAEAEEVISTSKKNKLKVCVIHNFLFNPVVQKAITLVNAGAIGELVSIDIKIFDSKKGIISQPHRWCHSMPGGIFGEYGPHAVYLALAFIGHIESLKAVAKKHTNFDWVKADELKVLLMAENGLGSFSISGNSPRPSFTIDIFGTEDNLHLDNFIMTLTQYNYGLNRTRDIVIDNLLSSYKLIRAYVERKIFGHKWYKNGHEKIIKGFIKSIINNTEPPVSAEKGKEV